MKLLLDIKDCKADFVIELQNSLSFVKVNAVNDEIQLVNEAVHEMKLIKAGKKKARNA